MDSNFKAISTPLLKSFKDQDFLTNLESYLAKWRRQDPQDLRLCSEDRLLRHPKLPHFTPTSNPSNPASASPVRPSTSANLSKTLTPSVPTSPSPSSLTMAKGSTLSSNS
ncbi:hypothetical protein MRB53_026843 [Persea americana]|uniref:Uncharacterized protein n=1 Tax=Persea americana TaxID=3435 RepID=A0ACC2LJ67_PERAE|nr:hypothetical protein MRB53_026843 [Persea americana]